MQIERKINGALIEVELHEEEMAIIASTMVSKHFARMLYDKLLSLLMTDGEHYLVKYKDLVSADKGKVLSRLMHGGAAICVEMKENDDYTKTLNSCIECIAKTALDDAGFWEYLKNNKDINLDQAR